MSGYRDETETLREELRATSAELARVNAELMKREPQEIEVIQWRKHNGDVMDWVIATAVLAVVASGVFALVGAIAEHNDYRRIALASLALVVLSLVTAVWLWIKALPRVKVTR